MVEVITPPNEDAHEDDNLSIFMAGGITNCPNWQKDVIKYAERVYGNRDDIGLTLFNPRRDNFPGTQEAAEYQVRWEYQRLLEADAVMFWFSQGSENPIVLFEYGKELGRSDCSLVYRPVVMGLDSKYPRAFDVHLQTTLEDPGATIHRDPFDLLDATIERLFPGKFN